MSDVAFWGAGDGSALGGFREALRAEWVRRGYEFAEGADPSAACVFNFVNPDDPKPFRRRQRSTYVIAVQTVPEPPADVLRHEYPMLVRALANLAMLVVPGDACYFVTPEQGNYSVPDPGDLGHGRAALVERLEPLATSRLVIDNRFDTDLEPELWGGDELTAALRPRRRAARPRWACCRRRSRSRRSRHARRPARDQAACTGSAASRTATCRRARTTRATG